MAVAMGTTGHPCMSARARDQGGERVVCGLLDGGAAAQAVVQA
jgi:hypothetical protein